jgi:hypothetical protein
MHILYVGPLWYGSTALHRKIALQELGHHVIDIDTTPPNPKMERWLLVRILRRLGCPPDLAKANRRILSYIEHNPIDILWVDKGLTISPQNLQIVKNRYPYCWLVSYSPDDMMNPRNQSKRYLASVPLYDLHVTTKSYNVSELKELGARDVLFVDNAYDPHTHRPLSLTPEEKAFWGADVGFIGRFEEARYKMMLALAEAGVQVTVRGPGWEPYSGRHRNLIVKPGWVLGDDYAKAICATKINLGFLSKANRDLQTTRSIEIPACGGFMLAERTEEHLALFQEGKEAEFFSDEAELIYKVRYYLEHEEQRLQIAACGRERCLRSGYSNHERLRTVLDYLRRK